MVELMPRATIGASLNNGAMFSIRSKSLEIDEMPLAGIIRLQLRDAERLPPDVMPSFVDGGLPGPQTWVSSLDCRVAWSGPGEWLCFSPLSYENELLESLTNALEGHFATVTLISDSRIAFDVCGIEASAFLAKGCAIDLRDAEFGVGKVVTTRFANVPAMLMRLDDLDFRLYFDVALAAYLMSWLRDAAQEFAD